MGEDKQIQKAGDNSLQIQAGTIINNGITEERARQVFLEESKKALAEYEYEAFHIAEDRVRRLEEIVISRLEKVESGFDSFADPAFQVLLRKAQITAACTGRESDYKILSELLAHRVKNRANIKKKASISKAVEIIDQIDDDSLLGLTVFLSITYFVPASGVISDGLSVLDDLYSKFDLKNLPTGNLWLDNLSILGAINTNTIVSLKPFMEVMFSELSGYACAGIKKDTDNYTTAREILKGTRFHTNILVDNELLEGYVRLPICKLDIPDKIVVEVSSVKNYSMNSVSYSRSIEYVLSDPEKEILRSIVELYDNNHVVIKEVKKRFDEKMKSYPYICEAMAWWDSLKHSINLTSVGKVIAHTNAKSIAPSLPDLD